MKFLKAFIKKSFVIFLVVNHLWIFNFLFAAEVISLSTSRVAQFEDSERLVHFLTQKDNRYEVFFDDSLKTLSQPLYFYDDEKKNILGVLKKEGDFFVNEWWCNNVHIHRTHDALTIQSQGHISLENDLHGDISISSNSFRSNIPLITPYSISITANNFDLKERIKAKSLFLDIHEGQGLLKHFVETESILFLKGNWLNQSSLSIGSDFYIEGASFESESPILTHGKVVSHVKQFLLNAALRGNGSVFVDSIRIDINDQIDAPLTYLTAQETLTTKTTRLGEHVVLKGCDVDLQTPKEGDVLEVISLALWGHSLSLDIDTKILNLLMRGDKVSLLGSVLKRDGQDFPTVDIDCTTVWFDPYDFYAKSFFLKASIFDGYFTNILRIQSGLLKVEESFDFSSIGKIPPIEMGTLTIESKYKFLNGHFIVQNLTTKGRELELLGRLQGETFTLEEEDQIISDAELVLKKFRAKTCDFVQMGASLVDELDVEADLFSLSNMMAKKASVTADGGLLTNCTVADLFVKTLKGSLEANYVTAGTAKLLTGAMRSLYHFDVKSLDLKAKGPVTILDVVIGEKATIATEGNILLKHMEAQKAEVSVVGGSVYVDESTLAAAATLGIQASAYAALSHTTLSENAVADLSAPRTTVVDTSANHATVHLNGGEGALLYRTHLEESSLCAKAEGVVLVQNDIAASMLSATGNDVTSLQNTGKSSCIVIKAKDFLSKKDSFVDTGIRVEADKAYVTELFGSYEVFQMLVNQLTLRGDISAQRVEIKGKEENILPDIDLSQMFRVTQKQRENAPRPSFVIRAHGYSSSLAGLETRGDASIVIDAKELRKRPNFTNIEGFSIYLNEVPKTSEEIIAIAKELSQVSHVEISARDVVLLLQSERIYGNQSLRLHLKEAIIKDSTLESEENLSIDAEKIDVLESTLKSNGDLSVFSKGHLLRVGSKTFSKKSTTIASLGSTQDRAKRSEVVTEQDGVKVTDVTPLVCEDFSTGKLVQYIGGDYYSEGSKRESLHTTLTFEGGFYFDTAYEEHHEEKGQHFRRDVLTPKGSTFVGDVTIHVSGEKGGTFVAPVIKSEKFEFVREEGLPSQKIEFKLGEVHTYSYDYKKSSSWFGLRDNHNQKTDEVKCYTYPEIVHEVIFNGPLKCVAEKAKAHSVMKQKPFYLCADQVEYILEEVFDPLRSQETDYLDRLNISKDDLEKTIVQEFHKYETKTTSHFNAIALAIVAVSAAILTGGLGGAAAVGGLFGTGAGAMGLSAACVAGASGFGAGITMGIASASAVALAAADGDPVKAVESLNHSQTFKQIMISGLTMGVGQWVGAGVGLLNSANGFVAPALTTAEGVQYSLVNIGVQSTSTALQGMSLEKNLLVSLASMAAQVGGAHLASHAYAPIIQTILGAAGGATIAAITDENVGMSAFAGLAGAAVGQFLERLEPQKLLDESAKMARELLTVISLGVAGLNPHMVHSGFVQQDLIRQAKATHIREELKKLEAYEAKAAEEQEAKRILEMKKALEAEQEAKRQQELLEKKEEEKARKPIPLTDEEKELLNITREHLLGKDRAGRARDVAHKMLRSRSDSPITKAYKGLENDIRDAEQQRQTDFEKGDIRAVLEARESLDDLYLQKQSLEQAMYGRRAFRECRDGDVRGYLRAAEIVTGFFPSGVGVALNTAAAVGGLEVDFARGEISASDYQMGVAAATIGAGGSALPTRGVAHKPLSFSFKTKLTDAARRMEQAFEQMVQRRSQKPVFVYAKHDKSALPRRSSSAGALHDHSWFFENRGDEANVFQQASGRTQKPYNSRNIESDLHKKYGAENVTSSTLPKESQKNVKLAGMRHPETGIVFNERGLPIFDDVAIFDTIIPRNISQIKSSEAHMLSATDSLSTLIKYGHISSSQFSSHQLEAIFSGKKKIPGYVWHHHENTGRMQLIPIDVHLRTGHTGGMKMWFQ
jgi:hypothetical protein